MSSEISDKLKKFLLPGIVPFYKRANTIEYVSICRLCGQASWIQGVDTPGESEIIISGWNQSLDNCSKCSGIYNRYPEIAAWISLLFAFKEAKDDNKDSNS